MVMARLRLTEGPLESPTFRLGDVTVIGRDPKWDIVLLHKTVSRKHAVVVKTAEGYRVQDLGSINGTFVDDE
jgi:pSer/pThr/pTyr-binding forkhead associated (FHA) protein